MIVLRFPALSTEGNNAEWVMDSGYTFHITSRQDWLYDFKAIRGGKVLMGNDHTCELTEIGYIRFKLWDGSYKILKHIRLVLTLRRNLISLGMLDTKGYTYISKKGLLMVMKGALVVLKGSLKQGLYMLQGEAVIGITAAAVDS